MSWIITGECNHCGVCCLSKSLGGFMLENPCITLGEDRCKFYMGDLGPTKDSGHCLIMQANQDYDRVRDRFGSKITVVQVKWFEANCPDWPQATKNTKPVLLSTCGYKVVDIP